MQNEDYPLLQLMTIKKKRYDQSLIELEKAKEHLRKEEEILQTKEKERDEVKTHKEEKIEQMRRELDEGTTTDKIMQMKNYLTVVQERLLEKQTHVDRQEKIVEEKKKEVTKAKELVLLREKDLEKIKEHKKNWDQEKGVEERRKEEKAHDELGSSAHTLKKIAKRKKPE